MNEGNAKQQIVEGIKADTNILVTVSDSPSVDELSAALGLTMILNKMDKRAAAVFSGATPPAITFLDPEKTFEGTVDSLRDFIIALDKEKADHLRYKVDGDVVKIFITPYKTTLSEKDLEFSQGDYNVEMVIALGVREQGHLDKALAAHGRILHDATVATISVGATPSKMGTIDWRDAAASSLCEMLVSLTEALKEDEPLLDEPIASAFLTGIVSATDRFSNDRTSSRVMTMAAQLMAAGANQQVIAARLQEAHDIGPAAANKSPANEQLPDNDVPTKENKPKKTKKKDDNSLKIDRDAKDADVPPQPRADEKPVAETAIVAEAVAVSEAIEQAEPVKDIEKELSEQLAEFAPSSSAPASPPADLEEQLQEALATEQAQPFEPAPAPEITAIPALPPEPAPTDYSMPGFEALDTPAVPPTPAQQPVSDAINTHPGNTYIEPVQPADFDTPVENLISGANGSPDQYVDPFSMPLTPLDETPVGKDVTPITPLQDMTPPPQEPVSQTPQAEMTLDEIERMAMPPLPPTDLPPLPPLPDFSDANLSPLPPPPPPPVFDQPGSAPGGGVASDTLGDIFGSQPPQPPQPPQEPPKPGQFRIPGQ